MNGVRIDGLHFTDLEVKRLMRIRNAHPSKSGRRVVPLVAFGLAGAALLSACGSSSTTPTTTTVPPGGKLSAGNAAFLATDLKAPAGTFNASGSTFVQPFFNSAFFKYTSLNQGLQVNY